MNVSSAVTVISCLIAFGSLITAIVVLVRNSNKDNKLEAKEAVEIHAGLQSQIDITNTTITQRLDSIDSGVRDLRADNRGMRNDITKIRDDLRDEMREVRDEAKHAVELAEAAHRRLDRAGIDADSTVHKLN